MGYAIKNGRDRAGRLWQLERRNVRRAINAWHDKGTPVMFMHGQEKGYGDLRIAKVRKWLWDNKGLYIWAALPNSLTVTEGIERGLYKGFSIAGNINVPNYIKSQPITGLTQLDEISIVTTPEHPGCLIKHFADYDTAWCEWDYRYNPLFTPIAS